MSLLEIRKLSFAYGDLRVLWDVDLEVRQGEIVTVVGGNGAGKSTTLRNVSRLLRPMSGSSSASCRSRKGAASSRR